MQNIVIVGAGFAGLRCALKLERHLKKSRLLNDWSVILFDKNSYHTYTPALYGAASAYMWTGAGKGEKQNFEEMLGGSLCLPISQILQGKNIIFVRQEVTGIDFARKTVLAPDGNGKVPFSYLVLALGSESITFGIKGAEACCYGLKTLYDALRIRRRIEEIFLHARDLPQGDRNYSGGKLHIAVVGGGATGVETVAQIAKYVRHLAKDFHVDFGKVSISLLEAGDSILAGVAGSQRRIVEGRLKTLGVEVRTASRISEIEKTCVVLERGEKCPSDLTIWAAGVKGPTLLGGYVAIDKYLIVQNRKNIFAIGDSALFTDEKNGNTAPKTAFIAEQQADLAAKNIVRSIQGKNLLRYKVSIPGYIISCGGKFAVVQLGGIPISGSFGWMLKRLIDLRYFLSILPFFRAYSLWLQELRMFTKND